jgi:hypothetical protein
MVITRSAPTTRIKFLDWTFRGSWIRQDSRSRSMLARRSQYVGGECV